MRINKLKLFPGPARLHSGSGKLKFVVISQYLAIFNNVVHSVEPGKLLGVSPDSRLCATFLNIAK